MARTGLRIPPEIVEAERMIRERIDQPDTSNGINSEGRKAGLNEAVAILFQACISVSNASDT